MADASVLLGVDEPAPQGDARRARLEEMFRAHHELVWRTLRRLGLGPEQAADAAQQAFLIAAERLSDIRDGSERAFLFGTALRLAKTAYRTGRRFQFEDDMDQRADAGARPEELLERRRAVALADRVLSQMEPSLLTVFVLFELEGLSTPEVAEIVGVPLGTAASRLRRAREAFRTTAARLERTLKREESP
ncbi:MAG TPA: sigma-70 family RNA polymerase sigma factor [Polyangiaceae bacterium]